VALKSRIVTGCAEQRRKVPARRDTPHANPVRIDSKIVCVCSQPTNRGFGVVNLRGEPRFVAVSVIYAHRAESGFRQEYAIVEVLAKHLPRAAMEMPDDRKRLCCVLGLKDVK